MEIYEKIAEIAKEKNISKKELVRRILSLEPHLNSTGEIPSEPTLYNYLNGNRELKVELIPFIAQALGVFEQELFICNENDRARFYNHIAKTYTILDPEFAELLPYASPILLKHIKLLLLENKNKIEKLIQ